VYTRLAQIHRARVEAQEHARATVVEVADLVDFVVDLERAAEKRYQRIARINHVDSRGLMPRMAIEVTADQIKILWPIVECIRG